MGIRHIKPKPEYTEKAIQDNLRFLLSNPRYILNNLYVFGWESDTLILTKSGYWYEIEIKISRKDFKNDFRNKHDKQATLADIASTLKPNYFYYAVPENMLEVEEIPNYAGLIVMTSHLHPRIIRRAPLLHKVKNTPEQLRLADKFYFNMLSAQDIAKETKKRLDELTEPYNEGFRKGRDYAIFLASIIHSKTCPYYSFDEHKFVFCKKKKRILHDGCNRQTCDFLTDFEEQIHNLLSHCSKQQ